MGYSPWGRKRVGHDLETKQQQITTGNTGTYYMHGTIKVALYSWSYQILTTLQFNYIIKSILQGRRCCLEALV